MTDPKKTLRIEARRHRARQEVNAKDYDRAADLFFGRISPQREHVIAAYMPKGREFDPMPIIERAWTQGIQCALPVIEKETRLLRFAPYDTNTSLKAGTHGILEPDTPEQLSPDIIITPLLSFDRRGYRLGQGGGYYDTTLAHYKEAKAVGLAYAEQICLFPLPTDKHDHKMDAVITPQEVLFFT